MKKLFLVLSAILCMSAVILTSSCGNKDTDNGADTEKNSNEAETDSDTEKEIQDADFRIIYDKLNPQENIQDGIFALQKEFSETSRLTVNTFDGIAASEDREIVIGTQKRPEVKELTETLADGEYAIKITQGADGGLGKVIVAYKTYPAFSAAMDYIKQNFITSDGLSVPETLDIKQSVATVITADIDCLRDPFILVHNGTYYAYGTGWGCFKNTSGSLESGWEYIGVVASVDPSRDGGAHWAPEVYNYNGSFYMITTYKNSTTNKHGCTVLRSDSPEGPFTEISNGTITPAGWDSIDGTLYVDKDGTPWMIFVREWTSAPGGVGSFAAAQLSDDLTHFVTEPFELFRANEPEWAAMSVTDACFMYTTKDGELLMLWSNFDSDGYVSAVARSSDGTLKGEWSHDEDLLFSKSLSVTYDGGHAMIFTALDGNMYIALHSPNTAETNRKEKPVFIAIKEENGSLVWTTAD